ncbi:MAG TPA: methylated-DNA--[protein]-cysteine S-methyltransferase [Candidatus Tectomicrobia bacterium]|nr:methylated-DNA--[protein]-cysteine S-methyltransferase [Candidatus Tectomicrobia bacterium]
MNRPNPHPIARLRDLLRQLRRLGDVPAPATILPKVLDQVGLVESYAPLETPIGRLFVAYTKHGVSAVMRAPSEADFERQYRLRFGRQPRRTAEPPATLMRRLHRRVNGAKYSSPRLDLRHLSDFERAVLLKVLQIPRGEVRPYAWVAREIGSPKAVRAVGSALRRNPIPLVIPCHRVVRSDGSAGEYVFGSEAKRALLVAEGVDVEALDKLARSGTRYNGSDTTQVYCFPTCRNARRITERHRVSFGSVGEATAAGYRPCMVCRPARAS